MQEFFDGSIFKLGKHVKLSINDSGEIIITEEPGENHIYHRVSEICAKIKTCLEVVLWQKETVAGIHSVKKYLAQFHMGLELS